MMMIISFYFFDWLYHFPQKKSGTCLSDYYFRQDSIDR